jgi:hypothetical protein
MSKKGKKTSKAASTPEPRASELLPPDGPAPTDPKTVRPSDADFEPDVETRKIGIRRVSSLDFGNRMYARLNRRSAGNSRSFWRNIEADDPFLKAPARPTDAPLEIYPMQRIDRAAGSLPKPQPEVARAYPPQPGRARDAEPAGNRPKPMREAKRDPRPDTTTESRTTQPPPKPRREAKRPPEPTHTPEPRPAPTPPRPTPPEPDPEPVAAAPTPPKPEEGRRLPPKPRNPKAKSGRIRTGRQRMPSKAPPQQRQKSAAEIRAEKARQRAIATGEESEIKPNRSLDDYREWVQMMEIQQAAYEAGQDIPVAFADTADDPIHRPKPKAEAKRPKPDDPNVRKASPALKAAAEAAASGQRPTPKEPAQPPVDRTPPKPKQAAKPEPPVNRSPSGGGGGGLDDLFGGGAQEGRVRIGKRSKPKGPGEDEEDED